MIKLDLHFFDGAAGAAGATGASEGAAEGTAAAEGTEQTNAAEDRKAAYAKLKADYKAEFDHDVKTQLDSRFRSQKAIESRLKAADPVLQALGAKYGIDPGDTASLQKAIETDTAYYEQEAQERGVTVEQLRESKKLLAENERLRAMNQSAEQEAQMNRDLANWGQQAEQAKALYPEIDLSAELGDPVNGERFFNLLHIGGVDVQAAYELIHPEVRDARIQRGTALVAQMAQQRTLDTIKANGMRPAENGAGTPANGKTDPAKMTPEQRREINERVMRGEKVDLRTL